MAFIRRRKPAPIGTVTLTTFFHADAALLAALDTRDRAFVRMLAASVLRRHGNVHVLLDADAASEWRAFGS